jgi:Cu(I)/Ag(I) efflux system membrane fusion protein
MAPGFQRWAQREPEPANPYFGAEMSACVSPIAWADAPPTAAAPVDRVTIDEARRAMIGVTTGAVIRAPMTLEIRAAGRLTYDERRLTDVTLKVGGYVTDLRVAASGQAVKKGQVLFSLYSPELYAAQQELILAHRSDIAALAASTEKKLRLWGITDSQIAGILEKGEPIEEVPFRSPASGYVIERRSSRAPRSSPACGSSGSLRSTPSGSRRISTRPISRTCARGPRRRSPSRTRPASRAPARSRSCTRTSIR